LLRSVDSQLNATLQPSAKFLRAEKLLKENEIKYASCADQNFKDEQLKKYRNDFQSCKDELEANNFLLKEADFLTLLNGDINNQDSFFVKNNLIEILSKIDTKMIIEIVSTRKCHTYR